MAWKPAELAPVLFLFGFAPDGVYLAIAIADGRGGLLPHPFTLTLTRDQSGLLSVALSLGFAQMLPQPGVTRHRVSMEPGLSSTALFQDMQQQSPGRLARDSYMENVRIQQGQFDLNINST